MSNGAAQKTRALVRPTIVLFGDSLTQYAFGDGGWACKLADFFSRKADIINRGYSGYTTQLCLEIAPSIFPPLDSACHEVAEGEEPLLDAGAPVLVTVLLGANDASLPDKGSSVQHVPLEKYRDNLTKILEHIVDACPAASVVCMSAPPVDEAALRRTEEREWGLEGDQQGTRTTSTNRLYAQAAKEAAEAAMVTFVDIFSHFVRDPNMSTLFNDGLHLSAEGNKKLFLLLIQAIGENCPLIVGDNLAMDFPEWNELGTQDEGAEKLRKLVLEEGKGSGSDGADA